MYLAFARAGGGTVLELMAGTGRLAASFAEAGHMVTAVDNDPDMLARAGARWRSTSNRARKGGALDLVEADITALRLGRRFDLVIVALNSLLLLDGRAAQAKAFKVIARSSEAKRQSRYRRLAAHPRRPCPVRRPPCSRMGPPRSGRRHPGVQDDFSAL